MSSRNVFFLRRVWLSKSSPVSIVMFFRRGLDPPCYPQALSPKGQVPSTTTSCTLLSRKGLSQGLVEHSNVGEGAPSCLCPVYIVSVISRVGDFCILRFYLCICRYGSSLSLYSTLRRILAAMSPTSVSSDFTSVFVDTAPPSACTARFGVSWQQCLTR